MTLYRDANSASDRDFVVATWASSYKNAHAAGILASEDWPAIMHTTLTNILARPGTRTLVAYEPPDFLYGWIAGDTTCPLPVVYYVYCKAPFRRAGIAGGLFRALGVDPGSTFLYACSTSIVTRLRHKIRNAKFAPAAARYTNYQQERYEP